MIDLISETLEACRAGEKSDRTILKLIPLLQKLAANEKDQLLAGFLDFANQDDSNSWTRPLSMLFDGLSRTPSWLTNSGVPVIQKIYQKTPADHLFRNQLLFMLADSESNIAHKIWSDLLISDPPQTAEQMQLAFMPFTTTRQISVEMLNRLFEKATSHPAVAASVYELANREFRDGRIDAHPAKPRTDSLIDLLGSLTGQLGNIEEGNLPAGASPESIAVLVQNSVSLIIAVIDTLALLGDERSVVKIKQALQLKHRRIQVEAAAALAQLNQDEGKAALVQLAEHPVIRPRAIAYAKELGFETEISLEHRGSIAEAESKLALWLSMPDQMGLAPSKIELLDQRKLYWPSYEDPVECYLFRFEFGSGDDSFRSIGISGPLTHAFTSDLSSLDTFDQYAAFAGWQTISDEIFTVPLDRARSMLPGETERLKRRLAIVEADYQPAPEFIASFFGEYVMVCSSQLDHAPGTLIVEEDSVEWIPAGSENAPIDIQLGFDIWKGRKLLSNFNPTFS